MIQINNLTFSYKKKSKPVLDDFSLTINEGGVIGLLGKNGAGKSTLLYLMAGLLNPSKGSIRFNNYTPFAREPEFLKDIFIVAEEFSLPSMSLKKFVELNSKFYPNFSETDLNRNLEIFELDKDLKLDSLSMGQKKKTFLSFALACKTSLLLLDEPTNGLDIPGKRQFRRFIVSSMKEDRTIIISTHQVFDVNKILDHVIITDNQKVLLDKSIPDILSKLRFVETNSPSLISEAIFSRPSAAGQNIILHNVDGNETELNLESLFEFAVTDYKKLQSLFI